MTADITVLRETPKRAEELLPFSERSLVLRSERSLRECLPLEHALHLQVLPLEHEFGPKGESVSLATSRSLTNEEKSALRFCFGRSIREVRVDSRLFPNLIYRAYQSDFRETRKRVDSLAEHIDGTHALKRNHLPRGVECAIERLLGVLLEFAWSNDSPDLQLLPNQEGLFVFIHQQGRFERFSLPNLSKSVREQLVNYVVSLLKISYRTPGTPIDGSFSFLLGDSLQSIRVHAFPTSFGTKLVLRLPLKESVVSLEELGFAPSALSLLEEVPELGYGLVLIVGSTGSGKTTTLYSLVQSLALAGKNIVTLEDPVERRLEGVSQTSLEHRETLDYSEATKALLRQRPDVIMYSEIRDRETAHSALEAALSGHLVLASVHCGPLSELPARMGTLGIPETTLATALKLAVFQQVLPSQCCSCSIEDRGATQHLGFLVKKSVGCGMCGGTGDRGYCVPAEAFLNYGSRRKRLSLSQSLEELVRGGQLGFEKTLGFLQAYPL